MIRQKTYRIGDARFIGRVSYYRSKETQEIAECRFVIRQEGCRIPHRRWVSDRDPVAHLDQAISLTEDKLFTSDAPISPELFP